MVEPLTDAVQSPHPFLLLPAQWGWGNDKMWPQKIRGATRGAMIDSYKP